MPDGQGAPSEGAARGRLRLAVGGVFGVAVIAAGAVLLWPSDDPGEAAISVGTSNCGTGWTDPHPGDQSLPLRNTGDVTADVSLVEVATGKIFGEVEGLAPGTSRPMRVHLGGGGFAIRCGVEDHTPIDGPTVVVPGPPSTAGILPVTENDLAQPLATYQDFLRGAMGQLVDRTTALRDAVHSGDIASAQAAWLAAHGQYQRLGAAYDAFGDAGDAIDGLPDGRPGGVADPDFTGFHRLEHGLWHGQTAASLVPFADKLAEDVVGLRDSLDDNRIAPRDLGLRAHEILEDTVRQTLTGHDDQGSGSALVTTGANLDGTRAVVAALRPLLAGRYPSLSKVDTGITEVRSLLDSARTPSGAYPPLNALPPLSRERLNAAVNSLVEDLAPVAVICEPRRVP